MFLVTAEILSPPTEWNDSPIKGQEDSRPPHARPQSFTVTIEPHETFLRLLIQSEICSSMHQLKIFSQPILLPYNHLPGKISLEVVRDDEAPYLPAFGPCRGSFILDRSILAPGIYEVWINGTLAGVCAHE